MAKRSLPLSDFAFARNFAIAWFRLNKIDVPPKADPKTIARLLHCWDGNGSEHWAKRAIIDWHNKAIGTNRTAPEVRIDEDFYASQAWRKVRYAALRRCHGACELCGAPPAEHALHVDHIKPRSKYPEFALDPDNLQVLCRDCNLGKSNTDTIDWRAKPAPVPTQAPAPYSDDVNSFYSEESIARRLRALH